ncbi:hypothetical protein Ahy_B01g056843 [Arachis hypogaea]|uniref:Uncharacterized protein n=1 Tax=Arachis hypogaea TaxID=3818 RepID=A0A445AZS9_ARAHY|nr:hypothetical protein Ahy_B01g056843 [Arachis hypogaea]
MRSTEFWSQIGLNIIVNTRNSPMVVTLRLVLGCFGYTILEMVDWALRFRKDLWLQHCDEGRRYGHMTTNLSECINVMLKGTRNLPVAAIVRAMYERLQQLFVRREREAHAQLQGGQIYSQ